jgi:hypothetical protein
MAKSKWLNALHIRGSQANINALASLPFVSKVDFADKSLNQTARIAKNQKTQKVNKAQKIKIDYAWFFIESNSDAQRTSFTPTKLYRLG